MRKFVTFGETMVTYNPLYLGPYDDSRDLSEYEIYSAGTESNVALDIERLGIDGVETVWVSRVGDDEQAEMVLAHDSRCAHAGWRSYRRVLHVPLR
jgi:sugar/nucleoside kinase (ribokinase family)